MRKRSENKYNMLVLVLEYLKSLNTSIINSSPRLDAVIALLEDEVALIASLNEYQTVNRTGYRVVKSQLKQNMVMKAIEVVDALKAYAKVENNEVLFAEMNISYWSLIKKRDTEATNQCQFIHARGFEHVTGITTYGITATFLTDFEQLIVDYTTNSMKPRLSITERMQLTKGIDDAFERVDVLLKDMDIKVTALRTLHPAVFSHYKDCRKIVNYRGSVRAISGTVKNEAGEPIFGATVSIPLLNLSVKSTFKGNFEFKNLADGNYTIVVERPGYDKQVVAAGVVKGETTKINLVLRSLDGLPDAI